MVERRCLELGSALICHALRALFPMSQIQKTKVHTYSGFVKFCSLTNPLERCPVESFREIPLDTNSVKNPVYHANGPYYGLVCAVRHSVNCSTVVTAINKKPRGSEDPCVYVVCRFAFSDINHPISSTVHVQYDHTHRGSSTGSSTTVLCVVQGCGRATFQRRRTLFKEEVSVRFFFFSWPTTYLRERTGQRLHSIQAKLSTWLYTSTYLTETNLVINTIPTINNTASLFLNIIVNNYVVCKRDYRKGNCSPSRKQWRLVDDERCKEMCYQKLEVLNQPGGRTYTHLPHYTV
jgi:hypothetical protein